MSFETVIGLEVHAQLSTQSKIFATASTLAGEKPNTFIDPVTLGLPGALPVLNKLVVDYAIKLGLATGCSIEERSIFARKHYFYPDLPKGYQISQFDEPTCKGGTINIKFNGEEKSIRLNRIHLEEDAGKSSHLDAENCSVIDLNRAGVPLVEIVSEPDMRSPEEAGAYMKELRKIVRYLGVCDGNMEEGSLRCDANISVRPVGSTELGTKVEVKNLNSFRFVEKAIEHEALRQVALISNGEEIKQETRLWDEAKSATRPMRSKEEAQDYRYFPDPDLLPLIVDKEWVERIRDSLPELPSAAFARLKEDFGLDDYLADILTEERFIKNFFDAAVAKHNNPVSIANWITTELFGKLNKEGIEISSCPVSPQNLATLVKLIDDKVISGKIAKTVFEEMFASGKDPESVVESKGLRQITDEGAVRKVIEAVLEANPKQLETYKSGKEGLFGFFVGQVMRETKGQASPEVVNKLLKEILSS